MSHLPAAGSSGGPSAYPLYESTHRSGLPHRCPTRANPQTGCPKRTAGGGDTQPLEDGRLSLPGATFQDGQPARPSIAEAAIIAKITQNQATNLHPPSVPFPVENSAPKSS